MTESNLDQYEERCLDALGAAVEDVVARFRSQPASFLYERDLQALLFARLFDSLSCAPLHWELGDKRWNPVTRGEPTCINPVKTEYEQRFDVAILRWSIRPGLGIWNQPALAAVETKLWQVDTTGHDFRRDLSKLKKYREEAGHWPFTGLCLIFCHLPGDPRLDDWVRNRRVAINPSSVKVPKREVTAWAFTPLG